ncbi:MAG: RNA polymerase sigma factor [Candidatus Coproplasma sp.]
MQDEQIIQLYFDRSEMAITQTDIKYGKYCNYIAYHILYSSTDAEECVNDTYLRVWNVIPPQCPDNFRGFIGSITRNLSINRYKYKNAQKRNCGIQTAMDEFFECVEGYEVDFVNEIVLRECINKFLSTLSKRNRIVFMQRYWYCCSIEEISVSTSLSQNNVKVSLNRMRNKFKDFLKKEGVL